MDARSTPIFLVRSARWALALLTLGAEFMAVAPWYMDTGDGPSLKHQKHAGGLYNDDPGKLKERFDRGKKAVRSPPVLPNLT